MAQYLTASATFLTQKVARHARRVAGAVAAGSLCLAPIAFGANAEAAEDKQASISDATVVIEDSVLVATRKAAEETAAAVDKSSGLEPISQHSDQVPELADPLTRAKPAETELPSQLTLAEPESLAPIQPEKAAEASPQAVASDGAPRIASRVPVMDSADVAQAYARDAKLEPARFHGMLVGKSTKAELVSSWGDPRDVSPTEDGEHLLYEMAPFAAVEVAIEQEIVQLIKVELKNQEEPSRLAKRLRLDKIEAVEILDEEGDAVLGSAYPEKGILFLLAKPSAAAPPGTPQFVTHMVIQPLDAEAFALRAAEARYDAFGRKLTDLKQALKLDPKNAYANWQLAEVHLLAGAPEKAEAAAKIAIETEPTSDTYRLCWIRTLEEKGDYDQAVLETRKILDSELAPSVVRAGALHQMGRLASLGEAAIAEKAISFHTMAIDVADKLASSSDRNERIRAKRLLIDAHLAVAKEISRRKYARKQEIVGQWIGRASGLAEEMIVTDSGNLELRLRVACEALASLANFKPAKDPAPWIKEAQETADALLTTATDPLFKSRIQWQLGEAYFHALRIEHTRKEADKGLSYGEKAVDYLAAGSQVGEPRPEAETLVGRLYFHMGAAHAVHKGNHTEAVNWYEKAAPLLTSEQKESELAVPRRRGEALVSMAVSYWQQGNRDKAVELTIAGSELMERAVKSGVLDKKALGVPYGNLATMHSKLGNSMESARFAKLARTTRDATQVAKVAKPPVGKRVATGPSSAQQQLRTRGSNTSASRSGTSGNRSSAQQRSSGSKQSPPRSLQIRRRTADSRAAKQSEPRQSSKSGSNRRTTRRTLLR